MNNCLLLLNSLTESDTGAGSQGCNTDQCNMLGSAEQQCSLQWSRTDNPQASLSHASSIKLVGLAEIC